MLQKLPTWAVIAWICDEEMEMAGEIPLHDKPKPAEIPAVNGAQVVPGCILDRLLTPNHSDLSQWETILSRDPFLDCISSSKESPHTGGNSN
ncbi:hypothetical protein PABG_11954 [Paracoccidioides brasiliensis Pb03]|nr:hypothetical protein PABG_11954 [Paracoccidioides brasiliensis Pb03]